VASSGLVRRQLDASASCGSPSGAARSAATTWCAWLLPARGEGDAAAADAAAAPPSVLTFTGRFAGAASRGDSALRLGGIPSPPWGGATL
jgi:hypothetical protein